MVAWGVEEVGLEAGGTLCERNAMQKGYDAGGKTLLDLCIFLLWYCLISGMAKGKNLIQTCLNFALLLYCSYKAL
jgi:hypothetical protein